MSIRNNFGMRCFTLFAAILVFSASANAQSRKGGARKNVAKKTVVKNHVANQQSDDKVAAEDKQQDNKAVTLPLPPQAAKPVVVDTVAAPAPAPVPQDRVDTIYYNKNWKVTSNKAFASYYRLALYPANISMTKEFKTYYISGELQSEGSFLELDKADDANSKFTDQFVSYFKDGQVEESKNYVDGKLQGEYTIYYNNGNIKKHFFVNEGLRDGLYAAFTEDGKVCELTPYKADKPEGFYVIVDADGNYSKYSIVDKQPVLEAPTLDEVSTEYKNGVAWPYYNKNGLIVGASNSITSNIGDYREIGLFIVNKSMINVDIDPRQIEIYSLKNNKRKNYELVSTDEYNEKIRKYTKKNAVLGNVREASVNANLGAKVFNAGTSDTLKEFQKRICRMRKLDESTRMKFTDKEPEDLGYLERTTVHPGEAVTGYIYTSDKKAVDLYVKVKINGIDYLFNWKQGR